MKAGRELNAKVAEVVMGLNLSFQMEGEETKLSGYHYTENYGKRYFDKIPQYSTDIAAAWLVVEKLREDKLVEISLQTDGNMWQFEIEDTNKGGVYVWRDATTAPHAICLAALEAAKHNLNSNRVRNG